MKILFINSVCGIGSTGRICAELARQFEKEGHTVKIAYGRNSFVPENCQKYAVRIGSDIGVNLHALQTRLFDTHGFSSKCATKKFLKWAEEYNPDLVWLHNIHGYYINVEMLFNWLKNRLHTQIRWTLHDCWAFTGHCSHFMAVNCNKWQTHCEHCPQIGCYPKSYFDNSRNNFERKKAAFTGVNNMKLITPSKWLASLVKQSFLKEYPVEVIYNTINKSIFKPTPSAFKQKHSLENKKIILGVASVWTERKGLKDFIKLAGMLDDNYVIVLVGLTDEQIKTLPKNCLGIKQTNSPQKLAAIYTAADVFFNPTYEDNYPSVNLEAQACGTPVITYDTGGSRETIYTENSKIVPTGDILKVLSLLGQPQRILYVIGGIMNFGGIESYVMNYYRHLDRSKIQIDFVVHGYGKGVYDDEIEKLGGRIFHVPVKTKNPIKNWIMLHRIMKSYPYSAVHCHMDAMNFIPLLVAKRCGIKNRISHSHNTNHLTNNKFKIWLNDYAKSKIIKTATHLFACSNMAGKWLYGEKAKFQVIPNAIDIKRFIFNPQIRQEIRKKLGFTDTDFVVGHIGRFDYQKNHTLLVKIFNEIYKQNKSAHLVCIGKGHLQSEIETLIKQLNLSKNIHILPPNPDVNKYYNAFDCFILPSHFEGLGIVAIEAQCNGLPCFISDGVPKETMLCNTTQIKLDIAPAQWANIILEKSPSFNRKDCSDIIKQAGYDIEQESHKLQQIYEKSKESNI